MKKIGFFVILVASLLIIKNLLVSIYSLWQKQDLLVHAQKELEKEKEQHQKLKSKLSFAESPEFIEEQARNNLFLVRPEEQGILLPPVPLKEEKKQAAEKANWQKWMDLFF